MNAHDMGNARYSTTLLTSGLINTMPENPPEAVVLILKITATMSKAKHLKDVHTAVHARNDCKMALRCKSQSGIAKVGHKLGIIGDEFVGVGGEVRG